MLFSFSPITKPIFSDSARTRLLWDIYSSFTRIVSMIKDGRWRVDSDFTKSGIKQGIFPEADVALFLKALEKTRTRIFVDTDFIPGYESNSSVSSYIKDVRSNYVFLALGPEQLEVLTPLLEALREPVMRCIGFPWRVVNIRCWKTGTQAIETEANAWHIDGFPRWTLKVMIYLSGADQDRGTTEIRLKDGSVRFVEGRAGCWILFKNTELMHRGTAPKSGERLVVEITIAPSFKNDQRPVCAGLNALYPKIPWFKPNGH